MRTFLTFLFVFFYSNCFSQTNLESKAKDLFGNDYFNNFKIEKFFLHTNKSVYFSGDKVWFKAYVVTDDENIPFSETTNLYLNIYNEQYLLEDSKLFYVENGKASGAIALNKNLKSGIYYIQLDTNWNTNFNRNTLFKIEVINLETDKNLSLSRKYNLLNTKKRNSENSHFTITRDSSSNVSENEIVFDFKIKDGLKKTTTAENQYFFAVLHRNGRLKSVAPIQYNKSLNVYKIAFDKSYLFDGTNTLSIFDNNQNILIENNFFYRNTKNIELEINKSFETEDSVVLKLNLPKLNSKANISISVLPENTKVYYNHSNILSALLTSPYIKNNNYNIAGLLANKAHDDVNMITQLETTPNSFPFRGLKQDEFLFQNEVGINIEGAVNTNIEDISNLKVILQSPDNTLSLHNDLSEDRKFKFRNLQIMHPSSYSLFLVNEKGKMQKAHFFIYNNFTKYKAKDTLNIKPLARFISDIEQEKPIEVSELKTDFTNLPEYSDAESLEEVKLYVNKKKKENDLQKILSKNGIYALAFSRISKPEDTGYGHLDILDYIQTLPSSVVLYKRGQVVIQNTRGERSINTNSFRPIGVTIDGAPLEQIALLTGRKAREFEYVILNIQGAGYGSLYPHGVLHLITRKGNLYKNKKNNTKIIKFETFTGFELNNGKYAKSDLNYTSENAIDSYSTIDWIPNFEIIPNTDNLLKINRKYHNNLRLIINGLTDDGIPFYKEVLIELSEN